ncbi:hypothetical protein, partial [Kaistella sp.]|uniref:hypothetical protein n=1 Tax=Kaistella sp. TaxID=2782235 RepID=UPI0035A1CD46
HRLWIAVSSESRRFTLQFSPSSSHSKSQKTAHYFKPSGSLAHAANCSIAETQTAYRSDLRVRTSMYGSGEYRTSSS